MKLATEIGITVLNAAPVGVPRVTAPDRHCALVGLAREGKTFYAGNEDISCPLARFNLGLDPKTEEHSAELAQILVNWNDAENQKIALCYLKSATTLEVGEKYLCYFPLPSSDLAPDVVVKMGSPEEFMPLVRTMTRLTGRRTPGIASGVGAMCGECTAIPIVTGGPNISLGCGGSRPHARLDPDQLLLALPIEVYRLLRGDGR
jgi:uncharacterized protein (DUF169 family)